MNAMVNCVTSVPDPRRGNHRKHALGETPSMCKCASVQVCKRASVSHQYQRQLVATLVLGTGAGGLHTCTFAHSKDSPAGATLHDEMLLLFEKERESSPHLFPRYDAPVEKNSGRIERLSCWQTGHVGWFEDIGEWQGLRSVIMVEAERSARNVETGEWETSTERRLYISSLKVDPELALEVTRRHWGVESMHWTLDVTYGEDYCRARTKHAAANRASVRRMAASLTIPWARKHKCTVKEAMMFANQSTEARLEMLS